MIDADTSEFAFAEMQNAGYRIWYGLLWGGQKTLVHHSAGKSPAIFL